jgi:hypothetical protein
VSSSVSALRMQETRDKLEQPMKLHTLSYAAAVQQINAGSCLLDFHWPMPGIMGHDHDAYEGCSVGSHSWFSSGYLGVKTKLSCDNL